MTDYAKEIEGRLSDYAVDCEAHCPVHQCCPNSYNLFAAIRAAVRRIEGEHQPFLTKWFRHDGSRIIYCRCVVAPDVLHEECPRRIAALKEIREALR